MINRREAAKTIAAIAASGLIPDTAEAEVLTVRPNEAVLLTMPNRLSQRDAEEINAMWDRGWKDHGMEPPLLMVMSEGIKASVIRKEPDAKG